MSCRRSVPRLGRRSSIKGSSPAHHIPGEPASRSTSQSAVLPDDVMGFSAHGLDEPAVCTSRNSVLLVIRKVQNAPEEPGPQPQVEVSRSYLMSERSLHLEVSLDKEVAQWEHTLTKRLLVESQDPRHDVAKTHIYSNKITFRAHFPPCLIHKLFQLLYIYSRLGVDTLAELWRCYLLHSFHCDSSRQV